jgi:hypothetical protein
MCRDHGINSLCLIGAAYDTEKAFDDMFISDPAVTDTDGDWSYVIRKSDSNWFTNFSYRWSFNTEKDPNDFLEIGARLSYACTHLRWDVSLSSTPFEAPRPTHYHRSLKRIGPKACGIFHPGLASAVSSALRPPTAIRTSIGSLTRLSMTKTTQSRFPCGVCPADTGCSGGSAGSQMALKLRPATIRE